MIIFRRKQKEKGRKDKQVLKSAHGSFPVNVLIISLSTPGRCTMQGLPLGVNKIMRIEILIKCQSEKCVDGFQMDLYESVKQVSQLNSIRPYVFLVL